MRYLDKNVRFVPCPSCEGKGEKLKVRYRPILLHGVATFSEELYIGICLRCYGTGKDMIIEENKK